LHPAEIVANASSMIPNIHHATRPERRVQADDTKKSSKHVRPQKDTLVDFIQATQHSLRKYKKNEGVLFCFLFFEIFEGEPCVDVTCFFFPFLHYVPDARERDDTTTTTNATAIIHGIRFTRRHVRIDEGRREGRRMDGSSFVSVLATV
jgi:hypothetical protein